MPLIVVGAWVVHDHVAGQLAVPVAAVFPAVATPKAIPGTFASQVRLTCGSAGVVFHSVRVTLNVAVHPLAAVGALTSVTVTPACGFVTVKAKFEMDSVPSGSTSPMPIVEPSVALPEQMRDSRPSAQVLAAPGYRGAMEAAMAVVSEIPPTVVGACTAQLHVVGQKVEPGSAQLPLSWTDTVVVGTEAFQFIVIVGRAGAVAPKLVRATLKRATQLLAALGVWVSVTVTPAWGFCTAKVNPEMLVVPAGIWAAMLTSVVWVAVPLQVLDLRASVQDELVAPG